MAKVAIEITQEDIEKGQAWACDGCPIAIAIKRKIEPTVVLVSRGYFMYRTAKDPEKLSRIEIPNEASEFIFNFDNNGKESVKPFSFEVEIE
jgi:hypothetical protein